MCERKYYKYLQRCQKLRVSIVDFVATPVSFMKARKLKMDTSREEIARRSRHCSLKGLKSTRAPGIWRTVRLLTRNRGREDPFLFLSSCRFSGRLCAFRSLLSLQPSRFNHPLRCSLSVFSGEATTSNQRNAPADTPLPTLVPIDAHQHQAYQGKRPRVHIPRPKAPDSTREPRSNADAMAISSRATK